MAKLLSIIIPAFNEEKNIPLVVSEVVSAMAALPEYVFEIILVNDGSTDNSAEVMASLAAADLRVKSVEFSRNFGKEIATSAGLAHAQGDAAVMLDADLQHPPAIILQFVRKWEAGAEVVVGVREKNQGEGWVKKIGSAVFYKIMTRIGNTKITPRATDFRLIDRKVINEFIRFTERTRITRGLIDWLGFKRDFVYFTARERKYGTAAYGFWRLVKLMFSSFVSHSLFPLKLAGYVGLGIILVSGPLGLFIFVEKYLLNDPLKLGFSGPAILAVINLFLVGIILGSLGLIALYIAAIHGEVVNRPLYVIRNRKNIE
jgi:dolichol-phosphate mannosyltransferase